MDKKKYRLIISDFDGTLCDDEKRVSERTLRAVKGHLSRGGLFAVSTGRSFQSIISIVRALGLKGLVSCFNGALVADIESGEPIYSKSLTVKQGVFALETIERLGFYAQCYEPDRFFASAKTKYLELYEKLTGTKGIIPSEKLSEFVGKNEIRLNKILSMLPAKDRDGTIETLKNALGDGYFITSGGENLVEVCVKGCSKGKALSFIAERYGVKTQDVLAVGDSLNDLEMLKTAGLGIAVANAEETLKKQVFTYPFSNGEDAVGRIIEEYGF